MKSLNFVVIGDPLVASALGKKGTSTDIAIYDRKTNDMVVTWTVPVTYPDRIQPLMQAVSMAEFGIVNATRLDKFLGEQILALDLAGVKNGFVTHSYEVDREKLKMIVKGTLVSNYRFVESIDELKEQITKLEPIGLSGKTTIPIDHAFDVKGVGTVILGAIRKGTLKVHDNLALLPTGKTVLVKSIQMHDDPVEIASSPARVGLAIKGATAEEISRGDVLGDPGSLNASAGALTISFQKNQFFKGELAENQTYMISVGLQIRAARIRQLGTNLEVSMEKPIVYEQGQTCILLKPDSSSTRIVGKGSIQ